MTNLLRNALRFRCGKNRGERPMLHCCCLREGSDSHSHLHPSPFPHGKGEGTGVRVGRPTASNARRSQRHRLKRRTQRPASRPTLTPGPSPFRKAEGRGANEGPRRRFKVLRRKNCILHRCGNRNRKPHSVVAGLDPATQCAHVRARERLQRGPAETRERRVFRPRSRGSWVARRSPAMTMKETRVAWT